MANFKYHGRLITAATKQMAVRKIIAGGLTSGEKRLEASRLDGATDELEVYTGMFLENGKLSAPQLQGLYDAVCVLTAFGQRGKKFIDLAKSDVMKAKGDEAKKVLDVLDGKKPAGTRVRASYARTARAGSGDAVQDFKKYFEELDLSEQFGGGEYIYRSEKGLDVYSNDLVEKGDTVSKTYWTTLYMLNGGGYLRPTANDFFAEQVEECEYAFDDEYGRGSFEKLSNSGEPKDFEKLNEFEENYFNERMINGETCEVSFEATFDEEEGKVHFELNLPYEERLIDKDYPLTADGLNKLKSDVKNA